MEILKSSSTSTKEKEMIRQKAAYEKEQGNKCFNAGRYKESIDHYSTAIQCDPSEPTIFANRAMAYLKLKEFAKAKIDCDLAAALDPTYVKAIYRRATAFLGMNDIDGARKNFRRVLELEPTNRQAADELKKLETKRDEFQPSINDPLVVTPIADPPQEWRTQSMTRITDIELVTSSIAGTSISGVVNGTSSTSSSDQLSKSASSSDQPSESTVANRSIRDDRRMDTPAVPKSSPTDRMEVPPMPTSPIEFFSRWGTMRRRNQGDVFEEYFLKIPSANYRDLFGRLIEPDILSDVIKALYHRASRSDSSALIDISERLLKLSQLERFQVAYGFLDDEDQRAIKDIINRLSQIEQDHSPITELLPGLKSAFDL